ncbi:MAG: HD domain-containing protein [Bradymonadaceae bacterium]
MPLAEEIDEVFDLAWIRTAVPFVEEEMATDGSHDQGHLLRVMRNARAICRGESESGHDPDRDVVAAAVLAHDLVNLPKDHPERETASTRSAEKACEFYQVLGIFDQSQLDRIYEAIERHSFSRDLEPESLEAEIVSDADDLDALGAVGIARTFHVSGAIGGRICHPVDPFGEERALDDSTFAVDHFFEKLLELPGRFHTDTGREMARRRADYMEGYLDRLSEEVEG